MNEYNQYFYFERQDPENAYEAQKIEDCIRQRFAADIELRLYEEQTGVRLEIINAVKMAVFDVCIEYGEVNTLQELYILLEDVSEKITKLSRKKKTP